MRHNPRSTIKHTGVTETQTQPMGLAVHLAVSFHSASSPSLRQISSSSVNRAWGMCSSSPSSVPNRNCTLWAGVSAAANETNGGKWIITRQTQKDHNIKSPIIVLLVLLQLTVWGGFSSIISCGVPLLRPLSVSVPMVTVASVWPPAQGDMNPNVEGAVTSRQQEKGTIRFSILSFNCTLMIQWVFVPQGVIYQSCIQKKEKLLEKNKTKENKNPKCRRHFLESYDSAG